MRKVLPYMGVALSALTLAWSSPVKAQDAFKDLDPNHWAYQAVTNLQQKGILEGYPDGYFRGKRTLTRYEFAVALNRMIDKLGLDKIQQGGGPAGPQGERGPAGEQGPAGPQGPPGMTPEEVAEMKRLATEFRNELTSLGANVRDINNRLDALAKDVADIKDTLSRMPKFGGDFFVGVRTDRSRFAYRDRSGALRPASNSIFGAADVVHDFHLGVKANLPGDTKFVGDLVTSNYLSYRGNTLSAASIATPATGPGGPALGQRFSLYQAQLDIPIKGFGDDTVLTVGRFKHSLTPLTYYRPDLDIYFDVPWYDDGHFVQDGFRLSTKFGSATTSIWAGSFGTATLDNGVAFNQPLIGYGPIVAGINALAGKPVGINPLTAQIVANQNVGIKLGIPLFQVGELGLSATHFSANRQNQVTPATPFNNLTLYSANFTFKDWGRWSLNLEGAKAVTQSSFDRGDGQPNEDNVAYQANLGWGSGPVKVKAGYLYIDPRYGAPGSWLRLGNWINPTNVKGPYVHLDYKFGDDLNVFFGGNYLEGARNRPGYLNISDNIYRAHGGVNWNLNKTFNLTAEYEGVFYDLSGATTGLGFRAKPTEQYITIGTGINLTSSAALKLAYQMINLYNAQGAFGPLGGIGYGAGTGNQSNASVFTTQLAVRF